MDVRRTNSKLFSLWLFSESGESCATRKTFHFSSPKSFIIIFLLLLQLQLIQVNLSLPLKSQGGRGTPASSSGGSSSPPRYYYRGGFRPKLCLPKSPLQLESFSFSPKISVRYDGRHFNTSFATLKKLSVRENMLHISCNAKYPVTLLPNPLIMVEKSLIKSFEDNMETECNSEVIPPKSPCSNYTVSTSIPVHLLGLSIDTQCKSYCKQVDHVTTLQVLESKGIIYGNISSQRSLLSGEEDSRDPKLTTTPSSIYYFGGYNTKPPVVISGGRDSRNDYDDDSSDLVQIFVSPVGGLRKSWNIKCSTNSDLTAKGARLILKIDNILEPLLIKDSKEYRKAGIHTIRATFDLPSEDVDYVHCLFPRMNDFPWISRHTSIHFHDPISYWECILRLCGAFLCSFVLIGGGCFVIDKWLHSDCCRGKPTVELSSTTSQSQLSLRNSQSQRSLSVISQGHSGIQGIYHGARRNKEQNNWGSSFEEGDVVEEEDEQENGEEEEEEEEDIESRVDKEGGRNLEMFYLTEESGEIDDKRGREREADDEDEEEDEDNEKIVVVAQLHGSITSCHL